MLLPLLPARLRFAGTEVPAPHRPHRRNVHGLPVSSTTTSCGVSATWSGPAASRSAAGTVPRRRRSSACRRRGLRRRRARCRRRRSSAGRHAQPPCSFGMSGAGSGLWRTVSSWKIADLEEVTEAVARHPEPCGSLALARHHAQAQSGRAQRREHRLDAVERPDQRVVVLVVVRAIGGKHLRGQRVRIFGTFGDGGLEQRFRQRASERRDQRLARRTSGLQMALERMLARRQDQVRRVDQRAVEIEQHRRRHLHRGPPAGTAGAATPQHERPEEQRHQHRRIRTTRGWPARNPDVRRRAPPTTG